MNNVDRIIRMRDYSLRYGGGGTVRGFVRVWRERMRNGSGVVINVRGLDEDARGKAVLARIWQGQWVAECDACGGNEFVDPGEPVFFCFGCGNRENNSYLRPVEFPENWAEIEAVILERPVRDRRGVTDLERAGLAQPAVIVKVDGVPFPLVRSWMPGESVDELRKQNNVLVGLTLDERDAVIVEVTPPPAPPQTNNTFGDGISEVNDGI